MTELTIFSKKFNKLEAIGKVRKIVLIFSDRITNRVYKSCFVRYLLFAHYRRVVTAVLSSMREFVNTNIIQYHRRTDPFQKFKVCRLFLLKIQASDTDQKLECLKLFESMFVIEY